MTMNVRNKRVVKKIDLKNGIGLELGPLTSPVVSKSEGNIFYLDHMSQADLKEKYKSEPVDLEKIVPIDYVLNGTLKETVNNKKFDYVIASHVIEHIPDIVNWLNEVNDILKKDGVLSLVIPDKRFTFDLQRRLTQPSDVIGAYVDKLKKPTSAMMYDFASLYADDVDTASIWNDPQYYEKLPPKYRWGHEEAIDMCLDSKRPNRYVDSHCHVFTPESFILILKELTKNRLINFEVCSFLETQSNELEFFVSLKKTDDKVSLKKSLQKIINLEKRYTLDVNAVVATNQTLELEIGEMREAMHRMQNSLSWRITSPLRKIKSLKKRLLENE